MVLTRQQYVFGLVSAVRESHGPLARTVISKRMSEYRASGDCEMAEVWAEAYQTIARQEASLSRLAEFGYVAEEPAPPEFG